MKHALIDELNRGEDHLTECKIEQMSLGRTFEVEINQIIKIDGYRCNCKFRNVSSLATITINNLNDCLTQRYLTDDIMNRNRRSVCHYIGH